MAQKRIHPSVQRIYQESLIDGYFSEYSENDYRNALQEIQGIVDRVNRGDILSTSNIGWHGDVNALFSIATATEAAFAERTNRNQRERRKAKRICRIYEAHSIEECVELN